MVLFSFPWNFGVRDACRSGPKVLPKRATHPKSYVETARNQDCYAEAVKHFKWITIYGFPRIYIHGYPSMCIHGSPSMEMRYLSIFLPGYPSTGIPLWTSMHTHPWISRNGYHVQISMDIHPWISIQGHPAMDIHPWISIHACSWICIHGYPWICIFG